MRKTFWITIVALAFGVLGGCNTVGGFGKDVEKVGGKISDSANKKKD